MNEELRKAIQKRDELLSKKDVNWMFWSGIVAALEYMESDSETIEEYIESL